MSVVNLTRCSASQSGVRTLAVVPGEVERQLVLEGGEAVGDQDQTPRALGLDGSDTAFDHRQAPMLPKRSEAMLNASASAPPLESLREELFAPVRDEMPGYLSRPPKKSIKKRTNFLRGRLRAIDRESDHAPREMVDGYREPPAKRPDLRQGEGKPRSPEAEGGGNGGQIDVPEVIRFTGGHDVTGWLKNLSRLGAPRILLHPANRGGSEVETRAGEDLGHLHLTELGAENLAAPHDVADDEAMVSGDSRKIRAVWANDQPRAARSSRIASRSVGGKWGRR
jgi:hypothetical protein